LTTPFLNGVFRFRAFGVPCRTAIDLQRYWTDYAVFNLMSTANFTQKIVEMKPSLFPDFHFERIPDFRVADVDLLSIFS